MKHTLIKTLSISLLATTALTLIIITCTNPTSPFDKPYNFKYTPNTHVFIMGRPIPPVTPTFECNKPVTSFTITPTLPADLVIDAVTGTISGTPKVAMLLQYFTITAANSLGSATTTINITIEALKPDSLSYSGSSTIICTTGVVMAPLTPNVKGGIPTSFTGTLPAGLHLDAASGLITGVPTATANADYMIYAANAQGFTSVTLHFTIKMPALIQNNVPVFVSGTQNRVVNTNDSISVRMIAHDPDSGDTVRFTLVNKDSLISLFSANSATVTFSTLKDTATLKFVPGTRAGNYPFVIRISDKKDSISTTVVITVGNINAPPQWKNKSLAIALNSNQTISLALRDSCIDPEGRPLRFLLATGTPVNDSIIADSIYRYVPAPSDSGAYTIKIAAIDDSNATDTLIINMAVTKIDNDTTPPVLRKVDPATDSITISASSYAVKIVAVDVLSGVSAVRFNINGTTDTVSAVKSDDSTWSAVLSGLPYSSGYNIITVRAWDRSSHRNQSQMTLRIKCDSTISDNVGPTFIRVSGPQTGAVLRSDSLLFTYDIQDPSNVDSVYWTIKGANAGMVTPKTTGGTRYEFSGKLTTFGNNTIVMYAVDKSAAHNRASVSVTVNHNTLPSSIVVKSPADKSTGIENAGLALIWSKSRDADGDTVKYRAMFYSDSITQQAVVVISDTSWKPANIRGNHKYFWNVWVMSGADTVIYPANGKWSFTTINHPPVVALGSPVGGAVNISTTPTFTYSGSDPDSESIRFVVQIDTSKSFNSSLKLSDSSSSSSYTVPGSKSLIAGVTYFWRTTIRETLAGGLSATTPIDSFSTATAQVKPAITTEPAADTVLTGQTATFSVTASGNPSPAYQWFKNDTLLPGKTTATLSISNVIFSDSGAYYTTVSNSIGKDTSNRVRLSVFEIPRITTQPTSKTATVGGSTSLTVYATGYPLPLTYQWFHKSEKLIGAESSTLALSNVNESDSGSYWVIVTNGAGKDSSDMANLTVLKPLPVLVASWNFDENIGTTLTDASGNSNNGTIYGATWVPGVKGSALRFNGKTDSVRIGLGNNGTFDFGTGDFTISSWIQTTSVLDGTDATMAIILSKGDAYNSGYTQAVMAGKFAGYVGYISSNPRIGMAPADSNTYIADGRWHNVVLVRSSGVVILYIDGIRKHSYAYAGNVNTSIALALGCHPMKAGLNFLKGSLDEIRMYSVARTPSDIMADFQAITPEPVAYWNFEGNSLNDVSGHGFNLTASGGGSFIPVGTGKSGNAYVLDGTDDYLTTPHSIAFTKLWGVTLEIWLKPNALYNQYATTVLSKWGPSGSNDDSWAIAYANSGTKAFEPYSVLSNGTTTTQCSGTSKLVSSQWTYVAMTWNGDSIYTYINGIKEGATRFRDTLQNNATSPIRIGFNGIISGGSPADYFNGAVDEVRILNYPLNATEVQSRFNVLK